MFLFINYCPDMFRPQFLAIFRELVFFMCTSYTSTFLLASPIKDIQHPRPKHVVAILINKNNVPQVGIFFLFFGATTPSGPGPLHFRGF
jgi:hypothetical protein